MRMRRQKFIVYEHKKHKYVAIAVNSPEGLTIIKQNSACTKNIRMPTTWREIRKDFKRSEEELEKAASIIWHTMNTRGMKPFSILKTIIGEIK